MDINSIEGEYTIKIKKCPEDDSYYLAYIYKGEERFLTQGTHDDIFYMIGDCLACIYEIRIPWWKRFIIRLFNLP